mgnify:FL=1
MDILDKEQNLARRKIIESQINEKVSSKSGDSPWGNSLEGYNTRYLYEEFKYKQRGATPPPDVVAMANAARHYFSKPRIVSGPNNEQQIFQPGAPTFGDEATNPSAPSGKPLEVVVDSGKPQSAATNEPMYPLSTNIPGGAKLTTIEKPSEDTRVRAKQALAAIDGIVGVMNDAASRSATITGPVGQAKAKFGAVVRMAGYPVESDSKLLSAKLTELKGLIGPIILNENKITDTERAALTEITGAVRWDIDDQDLTIMLLNVVDILEKYSAE